CHATEEIGDVRLGLDAQVAAERRDEGGVGERGALDGLAGEGDEARLAGEVEGGLREPGLAHPGGAGEEQGPAVMGGGAAARGERGEVPGPADQDGAGDRGGEHRIPLGTRRARGRRPRVGMSITKLWNPQPGWERYSW